MYGYDYATGGAMKNNAPSELQALLQAQFGSRVTVSNEGVPSSTLGTLIAGTDGAHLPIDQQMARSKADIVIVNHGIDDSVWGGEPIPQFISLEAQFIATAEKYGKVAVIEEPGPVCATNYQNVQQYVAAIDTFAQQAGTPLVSQYQYILSLPNWNTHFTNCIFPDAWTYSIKAQREAAVIAPLVNKLIGE